MWGRRKVVGLSPCVPENRRMHMCTLHYGTVSVGCAALSTRFPIALRQTAADGRGYRIRDATNESRTGQDVGSAVPRRVDIPPRTAYDPWVGTRRLEGMERANEP